MGNFGEKSTWKPIVIFSHFQFSNWFYSKRIVFSECAKHRVRRAQFDSFRRIQMYCATSVARFSSKRFIWSGSSQWIKTLQKYFLVIEKQSHFRLLRVLLCEFIFLNISSSVKSYHNVDSQPIIYQRVPSLELIISTYSLIIPSVIKFDQRFGHERTQTAIF